MEKTLQELAAFLHGTLENDDPTLRITGVNGLAEAGSTEISFAVQPYVEFCHKSRAGALILAPGDRALDRPVIRVENPKQAFAELLELFRPQDHRFCRKGEEGLNRIPAEHRSNQDRHK